MDGNNPFPLSENKFRLPSVTTFEQSDAGITNAGQEFRGTQAGKGIHGTDRLRFFLTTSSVQVENHLHSARACAHTHMLIFCLQICLFT